MKIIGVPTTSMKKAMKRICAIISRICRRPSEGIRNSAPALKAIKAKVVLLITVAIENGFWVFTVSLGLSMPVTWGPLANPTVM